MFVSDLYIIITFIVMRLFITIPLQKLAKLHPKMCSQNDCWYHHTYVYTTKCLSIVLGEKWNFLTSIMYWLPSIMLQVYSKWTSYSKAIHPNNLQCPLFCTNTQISSTYGGFYQFFFVKLKNLGRGNQIFREPEE